MPTCRFCKSEIPEGATRCGHCTSYLDGEQAQTTSSQVTYVVDKGLISFAKFALPTLAIFVTVALSFYGLDLKDVQKQIEHTHEQTKTMDEELKKAKSEWDRAKPEMESLKSEIEKSLQSVRTATRSANSAADEARKTAEQIQGIEKAAEQSKLRIDFIMGSMQLKAPPPIEVSGLKLSIYDAKNQESLPGVLVRSEGDPPVADPSVNAVYDNIGMVYKFYDVEFNYSVIGTKNSKIVATVHYGDKYNNAFWDGHQLVAGDGDGVVFRAGSLVSLSIVANEVSTVVVQNTSRLDFENESGAAFVSFKDIFSCLIEQWSNKKTVDEASWLVGAAVWAQGGSETGLRSVKAPGTAYNNDQMGKDPQPDHMSKYVHMPNNPSGDHGGVHINSGIPNKAFYEFAKKLKGYAWEKAGKVWFEAYTTRLKSNATFQDVANATLAVAKAKFGKNSFESNALIESWASVGIVVDAASGKSIR